MQANVLDQLTERLLSVYSSTTGLQPTGIPPFIAIMRSFHEVKKSIGKFSTDLKENFEDTGKFMTDILEGVTVGAGNVTIEQMNKMFEEQHMKLTDLFEVSTGGTRQGTMNQGNTIERHWDWGRTLFFRI